MKQYLGQRLSVVLARVTLAKMAIESAEGAQDLANVADLFDSIAQVLRVYQYEWQKQVISGMAGGLNPLEVAERSFGGLVRLD